MEENKEVVGVLQRLDVIKSLSEELLKKKEEYVLELRARFRDYFVGRMADVEGLSSVGWSRYTPYFNDGDQCVFSVNCDYFYMTLGGQSYTNVQVQTEDYTAREYSIKKGVHDYDELSLLYEDSDFNKKLYHLLDDLSTVLRELGDDLLHMLFGDHVQVSITLDGLVVEEYEHE